MRLPPISIALQKKEGKKGGNIILQNEGGSVNIQQLFLPILSFHSPTDITSLCTFIENVTKDIYAAGMHTLTEDGQTDRQTTP